MASGKQSSQTKYRSVLSRTLVLVLKPSSDACSTAVRRLTCKKIENVFEDFKKCNKDGISVPLRDAIDDIHLVGWLSSFTLLLQGSSEDMDTIEQAWVGRMLKPPQNFLIKNFGEISTLNMKEVPQSQFISICETLLQIITTLNENKIRATLECIMSRLFSGFESIIVPPLSAIRRSLDLLVKEMMLYVIDGSYYVRSAKISGARDCLEKNPLGSDFSGRKSVEARENSLDNNTHSSKEKTLLNDFQLDDGHKHLRSNVKEVKKWKINDTKVVGEERNTNVLTGKNYIKLGTGNSKMEGDNVQINKPSSNILNKKISQGNHFYRKFTNPETAADESLDIEDSIVNKKKSDKHFSFLGRLSRLFRIASSGSEEELTNEECQSGTEDCFNNTRHEQHLIHDKQKRSKNCKVSKSYESKREKECLERKESVKVNKKNFSSKRCNEEDEQKAIDRRKQSQAKYKTSATKYKLSQKGDSATSTSPKGQTPSILPKPFHSYSSTQCKKENFDPVSRKNIYSSSKKYVRSKRQDSPPDFHSSWSESSCFTDRPNSESDFYSDNTCVELPRKSFDYSSDVIYAERLRQTGENGNLNFCSTQAICGDLELSTPSPTLSGDGKQEAYIAVIEENRETAKSQGSSFDNPDQQPSSEGNNANGIQSQLPLQLIGVL